MNEWDLEIDIQSAADRAVNEREDRLVQARDLVKTGVPFLDACLLGMRKSDLLLIGGRSGGGKTELATQIAKVNAMRGKRVYYFALEAEDKEIERRIKYRLIAHFFFKDKNRPKIEISYRDWLYGLLDAELAPYELEACKVIEAKYKTLYTIYRKKEFMVTHFERYMLAIKDQADLVIVDHLDYFDYEDSVEENKAKKKTVKAIRDLALLTKVPVVLIAHIRKKDRLNKAIMPDLEDFMGSSDVYKICTMAVLLAAYKKDGLANAKSWPTLMRVAKFRVDGSAERFLGKVYFDIDKNEYEQGYSLGLFRDGLETFEPIVDLGQTPKWARKKGA
jgi:replicative DNA helicase